MQIYDLCLSPTVKQTAHFMFVLIITNILYHCLAKISYRISDSLVHVMSTIIGLTYLYMFSFYGNVEVLFIIPVVYLSYYALCEMEQRVFEAEFSTGITIGATFASILISCEYYYPDHEAWLKVRSVVMVAMMKIISLAFDIHRNHRLPTLIEYSGYIWCPANSHVGPWITFKEYNRGNRSNTINFSWVIGLIKYFIMAMGFVCFSNCISTYLISDNSNVFLLSFRHAMSFRMSHYFISFVGSTAMVAAGFRNDIKSSHVFWNYTITRPYETEFPRSLACVVANWNLPAHNFLKKYIYPLFLPYGQLMAVLMTFFVTAMLLGLSVEVSVVLLTLCVFSYAQSRFQERTARMLDACIRIRPCKVCKYYYRCDSNLVRFFNLLYTISTIILMTYIGCLMEDINHTRTVREIADGITFKWSQLNGIGHFISCICLTISWILG